MVMSRRLIDSLLTQPSTTTAIHHEMDSSRMKSSQFSVHGSPNHGLIFKTSFLFLISGFKKKLKMYVHALCLTETFI